MYAKQYSVHIPQGTETSEGYVSMIHNTQYAIRMKNDRNVPCDAVVTVDGNHIGTWRIQAFSTVEIDRPADKPRRLTFYRLDSVEAQQAQLQKNNDLGLVSVEFKPSKQFVINTVAPLSEWDTTSIKRPPFNGERESYGVSTSTYGTTSSAGGTGLSGQSDQVFSSARPLDYDMANAFTINLRLIANSSVPAIEPLTPRSTPVPPLIA